MPIFLCALCNKGTFCILVLHSYHPAKDNWAVRSANYYALAEWVQPMLSVECKGGMGVTKHDVGNNYVVLFCLHEILKTSVITVVF